MNEPLICHIINSLPEGGAENFVYQLIRKTNRYQTAVAYFDQNNELHDRISTEADYIISINQNKKYEIRSILSLGKKIAKLDPDLLHLHLPYAQVIGRIIGLYLEIPTISTHHGLPSLTHPVTQTFEMTTRKSDFMEIAVSEGVRNEAQCGLVPWKTIHNGIDTDEFRNVDTEPPSEVKLFVEKDTPTILNVGRHIPEKSQKNIIRTADELRSRGIDCNFVIVGWGELEQELRNEINKLDLQDQVLMTGYISDMPPVYHAADAFLCSSIKEGLPITLLEAMATGLPLLGSDIPGVNEIVLEGEVGFLFDPNSPKCIANKIELLLSNNNLCNMSKASYNRVEQFSLTSALESYFEVYNSAIDT